MSLPSIKTSLPILLICWGVGAVVSGMSPLLVYPLMWAVVGAAVLGIDRALGEASAPGAAAGSASEPTAEA